MIRTANRLQSQTDQSNTLLGDHCEKVQSNCTHCGICVRECHFLNKYGDPGQFADSYDSDGPVMLARAFECNLCGLCASVCPDGIDPAHMFLALRREAVRRGLPDFPEHRGLRKYESIGNSALYSWYALPPDCDTIFFPGCSLVGSRAATTWKTFKHLQNIIP